MVYQRSSLKRELDQLTNIGLITITPNIGLDYQQWDYLDDNYDWWIKYYDEFKSLDNWYNRIGFLENN